MKPGSIFSSNVRDILRSVAYKVTMRFNLLRALAPVFTAVSCTLLSSCGLAVMMSSDPAPVLTPVQPAPLAKNVQYVAPTIKAPTLVNPSSSLSSDISGNTQISWSRGNPNQKYIALTFDDGPVTSNTTRLLDMLKRRNIKATFYVLGNRVQNNPSLVKRMVAEGHELGNHTWTHGKLTNMSDTKVRWELDKNRDAIVAATGIKPRTMRPPYGALSTRQRNWIFKEYGYPTILWDVDPEDWKKPGISVVKDRILSKTRNGSIILLHDLHSVSVDAVPSTVDALLRKGYKFVTVSQLIALSK